MPWFCLKSVLWMPVQNHPTSTYVSGQRSRQSAEFVGHLRRHRRGGLPLPRRSWIASSNTWGECQIECQCLCHKTSNNMSEYVCIIMYIIYIIYIIIYIYIYNMYVYFQMICQKLCQNRLSGFSDQSQQLVVFELKELIRVVAPKKAMWCECLRGTYYITP